MSGVKDKRKAVSKRQTHNTPKTKMAEQREHTEMSEVIAKAMAEAMQIAIQTMAEMQSRMEETQQGPKIGGPVLKQPQFNWDVTDKYSEWKPSC